jgi:hypothetical protein
VNNPRTLNFTNMYTKSYKRSGVHWTHVRASAQNTDIIPGKGADADDLTGWWRGGDDPLVFLPSAWLRGQPCNGD